MSQTRAQLLKGFSNTSAPDDAITVDSSGRVGIGASASSYNASADNLVVGGTGDTGVTIASGSSSQGSLFFADGTSGSAVAEGYLIYVHSSNYMALGTGNTERMRILSDGTIRLASGCPGIDFSQIQTNASGMTSETLDSYEEGTWTPKYQTRDGSNILHDLSGSAYSRQTGSYCKVGRLVFVRCRLTLSTQGTATTGSVNVAGLPFTVNTVSEGWTSISLGFSSAWTTAAPQACLAVPGGNELQLYYNAGADARTDMSAGINQGHLSNTADVILAGTYLTN